MAITATFLADFDRFKASAESAAVAMKGVEAGGVKLQSKFEEVGAASDRAAPKVQGMRTALSSFDGVLASMGVNIGTEIRGLNDLADASGKTFTQLGLIATAGLAAGAALAGWKVGRLVADFFDLDVAIGNATAKMLGWGDVAGQTAGAKQDVINKAIANGAAVTISYTEAIAFNTVAHKANQAGMAQRDAVLKQHAAELAKIAAEEAKWALIMAELNSAGGTWGQTLDGINGSVVEAVKFYLQAGVAQGTLATAYALTSTQVKAVASALADELAAGKILAEFRTIAGAREQEIIQLRTTATNAGVIATLEAQKASEAANAVFLSGALAAAHAQDALNVTIKGVTGSYWEQIDAAARASGVTVVGNRPGEGPGINGAPALGGGSFSFQAGGTTDPRVLGYLSMGYTIGEAQALAGGYGGSIGAPLKRFASGGPVLSDGPIYAHAGEFVIPKGGGGATVTNHIYVNGTAEDVARKVAAEVLRTVMASTKL